MVEHSPSKRGVRGSIPRRPQAANSKAHGWPTDLKVERCFIDDCSLNVQGCIKATIMLALAEKRADAHR